eukprot:1158418-Pelagomonas_calceolata.AAC.6
MQACRRCYCTAMADCAELTADINAHKAHQHEAGGTRPAARQPPPWQECQPGSNNVHKREFRLSILNCGANSDVQAAQYTQVQAAMCKLLSILGCKRQCARSSVYSVASGNVHKWEQHCAQVGAQLQYLAQPQYTQLWLRCSTS